MEAVDTDMNEVHSDDEVSPMHLDKTNSESKDPKKQAEALANEITKIKNEIEVVKYYQQIAEQKKKLLKKIEKQYEYAVKK